MRHARLAAEAAKAEKEADAAARLKTEEEAVVKLASEKAEAVRVVAKEDAARLKAEEEEEVARLADEEAMVVAATAKFARRRCGKMLAQRQCSRLTTTVPRWSATPRGAALLASQRSRRRTPA